VSDEDTLFEIAREMALMIVQRAEDEGFQVLPKRLMFFRSDIGNLEQDIMAWLEEYMRPQP
jgi:hypothetical protein